jgi:hypothetical protein
LLQTSQSPSLPSPTKILSLDKQLESYKKQLEEEKQKLEYDKDKLLDTECELRYLQSVKNRDIEMKKEYKNMLRSDKRTYIKIKTDIENSKTGKSFIPPMFATKYKIFEFLVEENNLLNMENIFDDSTEIDDVECAIYYMIVDVMDIYHRIIEYNSSDSEIDGNSNDNDNDDKLNKMLKELEENTFTKVDDCVYDSIKDELEEVKNIFIEWLDKLYENENVEIHLTEKRLNELNNKSGKANHKMFLSDICEDNDDIDEKNHKPGNNTYDKVWLN